MANVLGAQPDEESVLETWRERGLVDAPIAFRAAIRGMVEGAEGARSDPANQCAVVLIGYLARGDSSSALPILALVIETANHEDWHRSFSTASGAFMEAYAASFVGQFLDESARFASDSGKVEDYLKHGRLADEQRWRDALAAVWLTSVGKGTSQSSGSASAQAGPRFVVYQYCISVGILSFKRSSGVKAIPAGGSALLAGLPYTLISLMFGWWGIPWGPIWTIQTMWRNMTGGIDVTAAMSEGAAA